MALFNQVAFFYIECCQSSGCLDTQHMFGHLHGPGKGHVFKILLLRASAN